MKWCGNIGFVTTEEIRPGVVKEVSTERKYFGDIIRDTHRWDNTQAVNSNLNIDNQISIVSDLYANHNIGYMRWIEFMGCKWKVKSVQVLDHRLLISIGDLYNG